MGVSSILYHRTCGIHLMGGRSMVSKYRSLVKKNKERKKSTAVNLKAVPTTSGCLKSCQSTEYDSLNSTVLSSRRKASREGMSLTSEFQALAAAAGNARSCTQCRTASCRYQQSRRVSRSEMTPSHQSVGRFRRVLLSVTMLTANTVFKKLVRYSDDTRYQQRHSHKPS